MIRNAFIQWTVVRAIMKETGWTRQETVRRLEAAKRKGISPATYNKLGYWVVPEDQLEEYHSIRKGRKAIAERVAKKHGKDPIDIERQINRERWVRKLRVGYFEKYEWDMLSEEEKDSMFLRPHSRKMSIRFRTKDADPVVFNNKIRFNTMFSEYIRRKWFSCDNLSFDDFCRHMKEFHPGYYILKPQFSSGGRGIEKLPIPIDGETMRKAYDHVIEINRTAERNHCYLVEECIRQHPEMSRLYGDSVNTVRVVTLLYHDELKILYAACRMGVNGSITDNASQGGISVSVNTQTGRFDTIAVDKDAKALTHHPSTGTEIMGFQIPYWNEVIQLVGAIAQKSLRVAGLGYAGWDVAIAEDGPLIIEGNNLPSPSLLQLPKYVDHKEGMRYIVDPYLDDSVEGLKNTYRR